MRVIIPPSSIGAKILASGSGTWRTLLLYTVLARLYAPPPQINTPLFGGQVTAQGFYLVNMPPPPPPALTQVVHTCALTSSRVRDIHACIRA